MRNVVNTANLLATQFHFMTSIWQWNFPESEAAKKLPHLPEDLQKFIKIDPGFKSQAKYEQENWAYKYCDYVFGLPSLCRVTMRKMRNMVRQSCVFIYWHDRIEAHFKSEHGRDPSQGDLEKCGKAQEFQTQMLLLQRHGKSVFRLVEQYQ